MADQKTDLELFHEAIRNGNVDDFNKYYKDDFLEQEQFRRRPLHYASRHGQLEIVELLINKNCDIEASSSDNWRAIHYACRETHSDVAKFLIEHNCDIESFDGDKLRPIHHASRYGPYEIAKLLIDRKCNIEATEKNHWRPIHYACRNNQESIVQLLVDNNCKLDECTSEKWYPIHYASRYGYLGIVKILIQKQGKIEFCTLDKWQPIHFACHYGYVEIFKELLSCNADIEARTENEWRPIHYVCNNGNLEIFQLLKNKNCDLESSTSENMCPIHFACYRGHNMIAQILIYENCNIEKCNKETWRPIHLACRYGHFHIANNLIEKGCNIEAETSNHLRPIHVACMYGQFDIVQLLIESGCDILTLNESNQSPLDIARQNKNEEIINILNEKISNPDITNGHRLILACKKGNLEIARSMLKRKCDINFCDELGLTPIHWACISMNINIVNLLIGNNCKLDVLDKSNRSPINIAEEHKSRTETLIDILRNEKSNRDLIEEMARSMDLQCDYQCDHKLCSSSLSSKNFEKGELVGEGGFGKVYCCKSSKHNREFAIKIIPKSIIKYDEVKNRINSKLKVLKNNRIVQIFGAILKADHLCIFMEFVSGGSLQIKISNKEKLHTEHIIKQILEGLSYLHDNNIIHRDIKPANILLDHENNVKLADFDLSRVLIRSDGRTTNSKTIFGTANYMAPEIYHNEGYTFSSDIWSLGVTIYTMITGEAPYHKITREQAMFKIASTRKIEFPKSWKSNELKVFLETKLLNPAPTERSTAKDLLKSNIFTLISSGK